MYGQIDIDNIRSSYAVAKKKHQKCYVKRIIQNITLIR